MITATETVTLFNAIQDKAERREVFLPTFIEGVAWHETEAVQADNGAVTGARKVVIRIPITASVADGKTYVPFSKFREMAADEAAKHWTIRDEDVIILGHVEVAAPIADALTYLKKSGGRPYIITAHIDNTRRGSTAVQHWHIEGV